MTDLHTATEYLPVGLALVGLVLVVAGCASTATVAGPAFMARVGTHLFARVPRRGRGRVSDRRRVGLVGAHRLVARASGRIAVGEFLESSYYDMVLEWGAR